MDCEFRYIIGWLKIQIPSLELEIINGIRIHLWINSIKVIMSGDDSKIFQKTAPRQLNYNKTSNKNRVTNEAENENDQPN